MSHKTSEIESGADILDVRDIIERFEELEDMERDEFDEAEYQLGQSLLSDLKGYGGDHQWRGDWYPVCLINESYFVDYCEEMVKDIGDMPRDIPTYIAIDWDATANNLRVDYSTVDFDGSEYLYR